MRRRVSKEEIRLGAIYKIGARLPRDNVAALLSARLSMDAAKAKQLVAHWATTAAYRKAA